MDWDGVKPGLGCLNGITHMSFFLISDGFFLFFWSTCLTCQIRISGNESERVCSISFFGSQILVTCVRPIRPVEVFPTSVLG